MDELLGEFLTETGEGLNQLDVELVLGAAETTTNLSNDFMAVPERLHGVFCFTPAAAASLRGTRGGSPGQRRGRGFRAGRRASALHLAAIGRTPESFQGSKTWMAGTSPAMTEVRRLRS
jgi:hypothetical protein